MPPSRHTQRPRGARVWRPLDATCRDGVAEGVAPGMVILVGHSREILFHRAYGFRTLLPMRLPMLPDTVFDLASLTKPIATTTAMMLLARDGRIGLDDPVSAVLPEFSEGLKAAVTFRQLLNHTSGLPAWKPYFEYSADAPATPERRSRETLPPTRSGGGNDRGAGRTDRGVRSHDGGAGGYDGEGCRREDADGGRILKGVLEEPLVAAPGEKAAYSDLGFILLGEAIERLTGKSLERFCRDEIFVPLGLSSTFFADLSLPSCGPPRASIHTLAATEDCSWRGRILCGEVHDENAFVMGGVAGHAGLFSSAPDLHRFLCHLARSSAGGAPDFLPGVVVREFLEARRTLPGLTHVLGWDTPSPQDSSSGKRFSARTVGHLGFTGASIWWDMERDLHVVLLTNRVHPSRDNHAIREFRPRVHDAAMEALFP